MSPRSRTRSKTAGSAGRRAAVRGARAGGGRKPVQTPADPRPVLLLGVGNILYGDEGLGVYLVHRLRRGYKVPPDLRIVDGGAAGWHLQPYIAGARRVVVVDAVAGEAGSIYRFSHRDVPACLRSGTLRSHELDVAELLRTMEAQGDLPPTRIIAMGVTAASAPLDHLSMGLSPEIEARLPALELVLLAELADAGVLLEPRGKGPAGMPGRSNGHKSRRGQHA